MILISLLRSVIMAPFFILWTLIMCPIVIFLSIYASQPVADKSVTLWGRGCMWVFGVHVKEVGRENLPQGSCIYIFNHTSFFDVFAMTSVLPRMRFGAKIELFKIPVFGATMRAAGVLPIARHDREKVFRVYERAGKKTETGAQFALSPEGGRNTSERLLPFKSGPFVFAINAQVPLVPVVIRGAYAVMPKGAIFPNWRHLSSEIEIQYLKPISTVGVDISQRQILQHQAYEVMRPYFQKD